MKLIESPDGKRRVEIYRRHDGTFVFEEHKWASLEEAWIPVARSSECFVDSEEAAEREAAACVDWFDASVCMTPIDVANSYDRIAERWLAAKLSENGIAQHERALAFLKNKRCALDIGCGCSGRFIDLLLKHAFRVEGLDISERMVQLAKQRHPEVTFWHADICEWQFPRQYDFISAWDSVWHVPLANQETVLRKMLEGLAIGGVCVFTTPGLDTPSEKIDFAMGPQMCHSGVGIPRTLELVAETGCICRHLEYDQYPELHSYVIVQRS